MKEKVRNTLIPIIIHNILMINIVLNPRTTPNLTVPITQVDSSTYL